MATYSSIKEASDAYYKAKANNDAAGMKAANDAANTIRASQGQKAQYATGDISGVAQRASSSKSGSGSSGSYTAAGSGGSYTIGSDKGKNFISSATAGSTMTGGDGSTWRKNSDGTTTISKGSQTWTYGAASGGGSSGSSGGSSSGSGASGSSGTVRVTLPTGEVLYSRYANGHVTDDLPTGSIVHTAGGDYRVTGGSAGNYTSDLVGGQQYTVNTDNTDYSVLLNNAINSGASWEDVQSILDQRNTKINANPSLSQYLYDDNYTRAMQYIYAKQQNEAQLAANLAELEGAYQSSLAGYESTRSQIAPTYQAQRNQTAASSDVNWNDFNEVAAANGLNTGAAGQAALSRAVTLQNNLNDLNKSEAEELSKIDLEVAQLTAEYNSAIAKAKASGDADLAAALYQQFNNYIEQKQTERDNAQALQQAQQEAQAAAQQDAYEVALDLITSGIMPTESQLAAAGMTKADAEALFYQVIQQQTAKSSGGSSGGSGGSSTKKSNSGSSAKKNNNSGSGGYSSNGNLTAAQVKELQNYLGVTADGKWGNNSSAAAGNLSADDAWKAYQNGTLLQSGKVNLANLQKALNISADGKWGPQTESALKDYNTVVKAMKQAGLSTADMMTPEEFARHNNRSGSVTFNSYKDYMKAYVYDMVNV